MTFYETVVIFFRGCVHKISTFCNTKINYVPEETVFDSFHYTARLWWRHKMQVLNEIKNKTWAGFQYTYMPVWKD